MDTYISGPIIFPLKLPISTFYHIYADCEFIFYCIVARVHHSIECGESSQHHFLTHSIGCACSFGDVLFYFTRYSQPILKTSEINIMYAYMRLIKNVSQLLLLSLLLLLLVLPSPSNGYEYCVYMYKIFRLYRQTPLCHQFFFAIQLVLVEYYLYLASTPLIRKYSCSFEQKTFVLQFVAL